jgi:hypothetical protein
MGTVLVDVVVVVDRFPEKVLLGLELEERLPAKELLEFDPFERFPEKELSEPELEERLFKNELLDLEIALVSIWLLSIPVSLDIVFSSLDVMESNNVALPSPTCAGVKVKDLDAGSYVARPGTFKSSSFLIEDI